MIKSVSYFSLNYFNRTDCVCHIQRLYMSHPAKYRLVAVDNVSGRVICKTRPCFLKTILNNEDYKYFVPYANAK